MPAFLHNCCHFDTLQTMIGRLFGRETGQAADEVDWLGWDGWARNDSDRDA